MQRFALEVARELAESPPQEPERRVSCRDAEGCNWAVDRWWLRRALFLVIREIAGNAISIQTKSKPQVNFILMWCLRMFETKKRTHWVFEFKNTSCITQYRSSRKERPAAANLDLALLSSPGTPRKESIFIKQLYTIVVFRKACSASKLAKKQFPKKRQKNLQTMNMKLQGEKWKYCVFQWQPK